MLHGLPRRSAAIVAAAFLLTGALSSCGFNAATNRINTISSGINDRDGQVDVLGAVIISGAPDTGVFMATLSNTLPAEPSAAGSPDEAITLVGLAGDVVPVGDVDPVPIEPLGFNNLYQSGGITVAGPLGLGDFVEVELTFDSGQVSRLNIPVVRPCYEYDPGKFPALELPGGPPEGELEFEAEDNDAITKLTDPYSCDPIEPPPERDGE